MSLWQDLRYTSRLGLLIGAAAATVGVIFGYDLSNIAGALLFITDQFHLSTFEQELVTTAVVVGEVAGAVVGGWLANRFGRKRCMVAAARRAGRTFVAESAPTRSEGPCSSRPAGDGRRHHCGIPRRARLPLVEVVRAASTTPAALLGLDHTGPLTPGYRADLVALDAHLHVTEVMHHGRWLAQRATRPCQATRASTAS